MEQIENEVIEWHRTVFPHATEEAITDKFFEELDEFKDEIFSYFDTLELFADGASGEFVDMIIVYMGGLAKLGLPTLTELIRRKMEINKSRIWGPEQADGSRERVK